MCDVLIVAREFRRVTNFEAIMGARKTRNFGCLDIIYRVVCVYFLFLGSVKITVQFKKATFCILNTCVYIKVEK